MIDDKPKKIALKNCLDKSVKKNTIIVVFANSSYADIIKNWIEAIEPLNIKNYIVVSMDQRLHDQLLENNIQSIKRECNAELGNIWIHRIEVIKEILGYGYDVIHSDADAVWLKDPLDFYFSKTTYDMAFSQGTFWPKDVHKVWGFVLCCGLFYIKSNMKTRKFIEDISEDVRASNDDQISCNRYLLSKKIKWELPKNTYSLAYQNIKFICSNDIILGNNHSFKVALLPHSKFQRIQDDTSDVYVRHVMSEKNSDNIVESLIKNDCWFLSKRNNVGEEVK